MKDEVRKIINQLYDDINLYNNNIDNFSLLGGKAGLILFYYYFDNIKKSNNVDDLIEQAFENINNSELNPFYCNGLSGFLDLFQFLVKKKKIDKKLINSSDLLLLNDYLYKSFLTQLDYKNFDFLHGAEGILIYFLNTKKNNENIIDDYLTALDESKVEISSNAICFYSSQLSIENKMLRVFDLGLAHGMSSTLIILSKILEKSSSSKNKKKARELLIKLVNFYLYEREMQNKNTTTKESIFSIFSSYDNDFSESRLAWCYGDLGIAFGLHKAGTALSDKRITDFAIAICERTTKRRTFLQTSVRDSSLCHGTAGIALFYHKFHKFTKNGIFNEAKMFWVKETLKFAKFNDGIGGFKTYTKEGYIKNLDFLDGAIGVALLLKGMVENEDDEWAKFILID